MILEVRFLILLFLTFSCSNNKEVKIVEDQVFNIQGYTQGTTYNIKYIFHKEKIKKNEIDSLLSIIDYSMSSYIDTSNLSLINDNQTVQIDSLLQKVLDRSLDLCFQTGGAFDVTIAPLVNAFGFGFDNSQQNINDIFFHNVGCDKFHIQDGDIIKNKNVQIDVNGIAQGFSVDFIADYFNKKGVFDFMIEIGGEVFCSGTKKGKEWVLGISNPLSDPADYIFRVSIKDKALATSGSTRKINKIGDSVYTHIMSPRNLSPIKNNLLSVSVIATNCMDADAYATAFMEMGLDKSKDFLKLNILDIEALFIFQDTISGEMVDFKTTGFSIL
tara:strand:+ start:434 stop:1420 length:987 start_codon:yes stop_codon:yes gene_type:complete